jgi:acyl-CoA thioesterase-1
MVPAAVRLGPDIVVVAGGRNDSGSDPSENIRATFRQLRAGLPWARIIAVQPMWDSAPYPEFLDRSAEIIHESVLEVHGEYLVLGDPLLGRPDLITADGVHPNDVGYQVLAQAVNTALTR